MKRAKPSLIPFLIVAAIGAATFLSAPAHATDGVQSISLTEQAPGGGNWGDPDQPDPSRSASLVRGTMPIGSGGARGYVVDGSSTAVTPISSRSWLNVLAWILRTRIGW